MKTIRAISYTIFVLFELLISPIFYSWYEKKFELQNYINVGLFFFCFIIGLFQFFLMGLFWYSSLTNKNIRDVFN